MDDKTIYYHLHLRRADILRERDNDRLARAANEAQSVSVQPKFYSLWSDRIRALIRSYYTAKAIHPSAPTSPIPARGEGD